ncbi:MAG: trypsin-like serine peptidase [Janthinobacterium lividum]
MTATSTNPADSVVYITSLKTAATATSPAVYEQASGVLIAPDEVLTAAHAVYDDHGNLLTGTMVSPGYQGGVVYGVAAGQTTHAQAFTDWTQLLGTQQDFAIIHLATPITNVPVMALGADFGGGQVTITGYPAATSGSQDSITEDVTKVEGYNAFQGVALGAPGDAHGSSGGPLWQLVNGVPTVVGLASSQTGTTGNFLQLTSADVTQIQAWISQDHPATAVAADAAPVSAPVSAPSVFDAVSFLSDDAGQVGAIQALGYLDRATARVVSLLNRDAANFGSSANFDDVAHDLLNKLGDNGNARNLAASLLEGVLWGHDGGAPGTVLPAVSAQDPGIVSYHASQQAARAGFHLGHDLLSNGF